jgi:DNA-binding response OmpR family regulator
MAGVIAVVAAGAGQGKSLEAALASAGFIPALFRTAAGFMKSLRGETFDLAVTADPSVIRAVRAGPWAVETPFILLTRDMEEESCLTAQAAGADTFVTVSATPAVLLARITALQRRTAGWSRPAASFFGTIALDPARTAVTIDGVERILTEKEFRLAALLLENPHRPLARKYMLETVWGAHIDPGSRTLDTTLCRLKAKLGLTEERGFKLAPVYGYGYRLTRAAPEGLRAA